MVNGVVAAFGEMFLVTNFIPGKSDFMQLFEVPLQFFFNKADKRCLAAKNGVPLNKTQLDLCRHFVTFSERNRYVWFLENRISLLRDQHKEYSCHSCSRQLTKIQLYFIGQNTLTIIGQKFLLVFV